MYCPNCQAEREGHFCGTCGSKLVETESTTMSFSEVEQSDSTIQQLSNDAKQLAVELSDKATQFTNNAIQKGQEAYSRYKEKRELQEMEKKRKYEAWVEKVEIEKKVQAEEKEKQKIELAEKQRLHKIETLAAKDRALMTEQAYKKAQEAYLSDPEDQEKKSDLDRKREAFVEASIALDDLMGSRKSKPEAADPVKETITKGDSRSVKVADPVKTAEPKNDSQASTAASNVYVYNQKSDDESNIVGTWSYFGLSLLFNIPVVGWLLCAVMALTASNVNIRHFARSQFCMAFVLIFIIAVFGTSLMRVFWFV